MSNDIKILSTTNKRLRLLIYTLSDEVANVAKTFLSFVKEKQFELLFNGQTIYLQRYLNDVYDFGDRRIYISNTPSLISSYLYNLSEAQTPKYIFNLSEAWNSVIPYFLNALAYISFKVYKALSNNTSTNPIDNPVIWQYQFDTVVLANYGEQFREYDFIVYLPVGLSVNEVQFTASINKYKLADKRFIIVRY